MSHVKLGQGFNGPSLHGEGVQHAAVVPRPYFRSTVVHRQQVRAQLDTEGLAGVSHVIQVHLNIYAHKRKLKKPLGVCVCVCVCFYPKSLQAFACPAVIDSHSAVFTPRDDVLVICS